jgi:hypothetical protein
MMALTAPMVRECCLPVVQAPPCHESKHTNDVTCASNQQAIAETKAPLHARPTISFALRNAHETQSPSLMRVRPFTIAFGLAPTPPTDLYLQTGALLI